MNDDLSDDGYPKDWHTDLGFHGFCKADALKRYVVRRSVLGTQFSIGVATNQREAAKLYDLALWKLAFFISRVIRPNFPETFENINQAKIDAECPALNEIYRQCAAAAKLDGTLTEQELRGKALAPKALEVVSTASEYGRYQKLVDKSRAHALMTMTRVSQVRALLDLNKLPEVQRVAREYEQLLDAAELKGRELQSLLTSHAEFYRKLLADKSTAI